MNKVIQFDASVSKIEKINPLFSKCNVRLLYTGANRNGSFIAKDTVDKAIPTLFNIPIVGEYIEQKEDFGTHGGRLEITDKDIKFVSTTVPYGVVPESAKIYWQPIAEADGVVHEYLIVEGAYLWTGRYEKAFGVVGNAKGQSMEIEVLSGEVNDDNLFVIDDMVFSALCILGDGVEPCFESANITAYSLDKDNFKLQFSQMLKELKTSLSKSDDVEKYSKEEGEGMNETILELLTKYGLTEESAIEKGINLAVSPEELEVVLVGYSAEEVEQPEVSLDQPEASAEAAVEEVVVEAPTEAPEEFEAESVEEAVVEPEAPEVVETDFAVIEQGYRDTISSLEGQLQALTTEFEAVKAERDDLAEFKKKKMKENHQMEAEELFGKFDKLSEEEIAQVREVMFDLTLEQIEEKLFTMLGKKLASFSLTPKKKETSIKIDIDVPDATDMKKVGYELSHLFERYSG